VIEVMEVQIQQGICQSNDVDCFDLASWLYVTYTNLIITGRATVEPVSHLPEESATNIGNGLGDIKRRLLQEPDWGSVSATRPLELAFTTIEEVERFGKRRRPNGKDRKGLLSAKNNGSSFFRLPDYPRRERHPSSIVDTVEDIQIHINGQPVDVPVNNSLGLGMSSLSSQSMLLDHEVPAASEQEEKEKLTATWITNLFPQSE
jgi:hypothetical protein